MTAHDALLAELDERGGRASAGELIDAVIEREGVRIYQATDALETLLEHGELYRPAPDRPDVKRTTTESTIPDGGEQLPQWTNDNDGEVDQPATGSPTDRVTGAIKQLDIASDDTDDEHAREYLSQAIAAAESALICLEGPDALEQFDIVDDADEVGERNGGEQA